MFSCQWKLYNLYRIQYNKWPFVAYCGKRNMLTWSLTLWFLHLPISWKLWIYSARQVCVSLFKSFSIILIGIKILCLMLSVMIPRATALSLARIGSQSCAMIHHFTGTEFLLNETEHKACSSTNVNSLLNGLSLVLDLYILLCKPHCFILLCKPHCFAWLRLQTLTSGPVSAITFTRELLIINSTLKSPLYWFVLFDVVILKRLMVYISSVFCCLLFYLFNAFVFTKFCKVPCNLTIVKFGIVCQAWTFMFNYWAIHIVTAVVALCVVSWFLSTFVLLVIQFLSIFHISIWIWSQFENIPVFTTYICSTMGGSFYFHALFSQRF